MNILDLFSSNVNKYRKMKGYSQEKLAELTGLHRTYIGDIELRKRNISLNNIQKIADALDIPYHLLFLKSDMDTTTQKDNRITIMSYEQFKEELNNSIKLEDNFYYDWLVDIIKKQDRYTEIFRTTNVKTRLMLSVIKSQEDKFDAFIKEIMVKYIEKFGYLTIEKNLFNKEDIPFTTNVFRKDNIIYLFQQYIRDDYSSIKKKKIFENLKTKYSILKQKFPNQEVNAIMWFVDDRFKKNKKYYLEKAAIEQKNDIKVNVFYGGTLFLELFHYADIWEEVSSYFLKSKQERENDTLFLPDFDTSNDILKVLKKLKVQKPRLYKKLLSDDIRYTQLRNELFPTGENLKKVSLFNSSEFGVSQ